MALRNSEKKLTQAVDGNSIPTFIIDNNHSITHWNKACESLTGISAAEIVGTKKTWSSFYAEERPTLADLIVNEATEEKIAGYYEGKYNKSILTEGAYEGEDFFPGLGEKGKWLFFTASPLKNSQGTVIGAIETFQDITGRKSVEGQLCQSHKMEAIGTLAGGVAHDFNNLLTLIIGNAQLALMDAGKNGPLYEEIKEIEKAGERAVSVTRQLLAFSRKQIIMPEILDINEEINETGKMLQRLIREDIEFLTVLEPELWKV
ncbi:MAG: PAS domain-containing protein, partial [Deltaproteobacteria bacterium]|nr:PAS domain-containing protein [Deltaproteobacteria bacterium]